MKFEEYLLGQGYMTKGQFLELLKESLRAIFRGYNPMTIADYVTPTLGDIEDLSLVRQPPIGAVLMSMPFWNQVFACAGVNSLQDLVVISD